MSAPSAHATARRNLVQRIDRFLWERIGPSTTDLSDWQANQVLKAIELLEGEQFAGGERAMMKAEKAAIFEPAGYAVAGRSTAGQLLERLSRVLADYFVPIPDLTVWAEWALRRMKRALQDSMPDWEEVFARTKEAHRDWAVGVCLQWS